MNKLPPHYLFALVLALCAAALVLFYTMVYQPRQETIAQLQADLTTKQDTAMRYRTAVAGLPQLRETVDKLEVDRAEFVRALPNSAQFGQVIDQIRSNVAAAGGKLNGIDFNDRNATTLPAGVRGIDVNVNSAGRFSQLFQVLRSLETQNRFTTVNNVDLTLPAANSNDPTLESSMNLTVYTYDPAQAAAAGTPSTPGAPPAAPNAAAPAAPAAPTAPASGDIR